NAPGSPALAADARDGSIDVLRKPVTATRHETVRRQRYDMAPFIGFPPRPSASVSSPAGQLRAYSRRRRHHLPTSVRGPTGGMKMVGDLAWFQDSVVHGNFVDAALEARSAIASCAHKKGGAFV